MNKCTEGWPNAPSDVSPDAFDAFLAHVAGCPFHEKALDEEEENIRSKFRLARGLDTGTIAAQISLSSDTVSMYRRRILDKLELASNADIAYYALKHNLLF